MYIEVKIREHLYKAVILPHVRGGGDNWIIILLLIMEKTVRTLDNISTLAHCYWSYIGTVTANSQRFRNFMHILGIFYRI